MWPHLRPLLLRFVPLWLASRKRPSVDEAYIRYVIIGIKSISMRVVGQFDCGAGFESVSSACETKRTPMLLFL